MIARFVKLPLTVDATLNAVEYRRVNAVVERVTMEVGDEGFSRNCAVGFVARLRRVV